MDPSLVAAIFGLSAALCWGAGDFGGGVAVRRTHAYVVVALGETFGLVLMGALALIVAEPLPPARDLLWAAAAGLAGGSGLVALYQGLSSGQMGLVAPVSAVVSGGVPVVFGLLLEGLPSTGQMIGFGLALAAVWLVSWPGRPDPGAGSHHRLRGFGLAVLAGCGFGVWLILIDRVSAGGIVWPLLASKASFVCLLYVLLLVRRPRLDLPPRRLLQIAAIGLADSGGSAFYALAAQAGRLDVAAVLSSLHPTVTVLAARLFLAESVSRWRWLGVAVSLAAVLLVAR